MLTIADYTTSSIPHRIYSEQRIVFRLRCIYDFLFRLSCSSTWIRSVHVNAATELEVCLSLSSPVCLSVRLPVSLSVHRVLRGLCLLAQWLGVTFSCPFVIHLLFSRLTTQCRSVVHSVMFTSRSVCDVHLPAWLSSRCASV